MHLARSDSTSAEIYESSELIIQAGLVVGLSNYPKKKSAKIADSFQVLYL